jgi:hypothetical protein
MSTGAQWRPEVKAALAANHREQRQRRGKRRQDASSLRITGPGMVRIVPRPPRDDGPHDHPGEVPAPRVRGEMEDGA